jgi:hypothetical protein
VSKQADQLGQLMVGLLAGADQTGPITTNATRVETPLLLTPDGSAAIITFLVRCKHPIVVDVL